ncbi:MAG TPA: IS66 family transposase, partial [Terriglobia bacterium]|nr:IS66 family transposase [Terriglobia bacterium]
MNPPDLKHIPRVVKGYIRDLEERATQDIAQRDAQIEELNRRIGQLEEQIRLLQAERFAPKSEKRKDRMFDEAEQIAQTEPS